MRVDVANHDTHMPLTVLLLLLNLLCHAERQVLQANLIKNVRKWRTERCQMCKDSWVGGSTKESQR